MCWVVADPDVLGGVNYPRVLRECAAEHDLATFRFVEKADMLPHDAETVVFCGKVASGGARGMKRTMWLSPSDGASVMPDDIVIVGEFAADVESWNRFKVVGVRGGLSPNALRARVR